MEYRDIILQEIDRVKKLHNIEDPYWKAIIKALLSDLQDYERHSMWIHTGSITDFDSFWNRIIKEFFRDFY